LILFPHMVEFDHLDSGFYRFRGKIITYRWGDSKIERRNKNGKG
jgi:hypothetical protein